MPGWQVRIKGLREATGKIRGAIHEGARLGMEDIGIEGVRLVAQGSPVARGVLANAISFDTQESGGVMRTTVFAAPPADVYAAPVETGSRPHWPPIEPLMLWVRQKFSVKDEGEARSIAFAVARKISQRGTQGAHMFEKALELIKPEAVAILDREIGQAIARAGLAPGA